jgi:hypothetical protein
MNPARADAARPPLARLAWAWALAVTLTLGGCGGPLDDLALACIDLDGPEFTTAGLPAATLGQDYSATVEAEIVNEPNEDELYDFRFQIRGTLPPGLQIRQVGRQRRIEIVGRPTAAGNWSFRIIVSVNDRYGTSGLTYPLTLCWFEVEKDYQIAVRAAPGS